METTTVSVPDLDSRDALYRDLAKRDLPVLKTYSNRNGSFTVTYLTNPLPEETYPENITWTHISN
jgi:hypothetical protein